MGLIDGVAGFDRDLLQQAIDAFAAAGIGRRTIVSMSAADLPAALDQLNDDVEQTPSPQTEWPAVTHVLGVDVVGALVGVSGSSARRYASGERTTPDDVADRLHFLALTIADLLGAYNSYGVRRWFARPRSALGGISPTRLLVGSWTSSDPGARQVAALASTLVVMGAT